MEDFKNQVALVTGAGRGIGRAVAESLAARGAIVAANDITPIHLDETLEHILSTGGRAKDYVFDVAKRAPIQAMVNMILEDWGQIDILINSAGVEPHAAILDMDEWDWARTVDVNLSGPFLTMQQVGHFMRERRRGAIVNLGAMMSSEAQRERAAFLASKSGLAALTQAAALEFAEFNVRVNLVCLDKSGSVDLADFRRMLDEAGFPQDIVGLIMYLCSSAAAEITGHTYIFNANTGML
jgi:3-oxoacyl-[acyl-carrier protein] reductase